MNKNKSEISSKQFARSVDMTPEAYDDYFSEYPSDKRRAEYRARKAVELIGSNRGKALSVGAGNFGEADCIRDAGFDVDICDISARAVDMAKKLGYNAFVADVTKPIPEAGYDYIFCLEVLEHVTDPLKALNNLVEALGPSGRLVISLPNEFNIYRRLAILMGSPGIGGHEYHHLRFFDINSARKLIAVAGLEVIGRKFAPLMPIRWKAILPFGEFLKIIRPQLFALGSIWLLKPFYKSCKEEGTRVNVETQKQVRS